MLKKKNTKIIRHNKKILKKKKKDGEQKIMWKRVFFGITTVSFFVGVLYIFLGSSLVQVYEINVNGVKRIQKSEIIAIVDENFQGNLFSYIKKNNYFFINSEQISEQILQNNKVNSVVISKKFPNTIFVDIIENDIIHVWCENDTHSECFIIENGIAIQTVNISDDVLIQNKHFIIVDEMNKDISVGDRVMAPEYMDKIEILGEELVYALNVKIDKFYKVVARGSHEVQFMTDEGWYIVVDVTHDVYDILDVVTLFMKKVELPSERKNLEYIDMRFLEKIFYKMIDGDEQIEGENEDVADTHDVLIKDK